MSTGTSDAPEPRRVPTVEELVELIELTGLRCFEVSGRRHETEPDGSGEESADEPTAEAETAGEVSIQVMETHGPDFITARLRMTVEAKDADFVADFGLRYTSAEPIEPTQEAIKALLERVSVMSAWPFLREAVATTAARMELPVPVLGMVRQGQFRLQVAPAPSESTE